MIVLGPPPPTPPFVTVQASDVGPVLATTDGKTLYALIGNLEKIMRLTCDAACIQENWQPLLAAPDAKPTGNWSFRQQPDGTRQWTFKHNPVFTFVKDVRNGDTGGYRFAIGNATSGSPWMPILREQLLGG
jgi:predicted lipoprotein with Yx(FWY)xxD motif